MVVAPVALVVAGLGLVDWFAGLIALGLATDAVDGLVARRQGTASAAGARLDTRADLALVVATILGVGLLFPARVVAEWPLLAVALLAYVCPMAVAWFKFGRITSYHTVLARLSLTLLAPALVGWLNFDTLVPLKIGVAVVVLSGIEELAITWRLSQAQDDVAHFFQVIAIESTRSDVCRAKVHEG